MGILNTNHYGRGFDDGKADALAGRQKNYIRGAKAWGFWLMGDDVLKTYSAGYDEGYRKGCDQRNR